MRRKQSETRTELGSTTQVSSFKGMIPDMYPSATEQLVLATAEKLMVATMARYDPSHDVFHGTAASGPLASFALTFVA